MKEIKAWDLCCNDCAVLNQHQPCEACPNWQVQKKLMESVVRVTVRIEE